MTVQHATSRRERRAAERATAHAAATSRRETRRAVHAREARDATVRRLAFGGVAVAVLAIGGVLAFGDFVDRPGGTARAGVIDVQSSMAGFTPSEIRVTAGATVTMSWWTDDAAVHLQGGVHTMIAPELGLSEALPAEGNRTIVWAVPDKPGTFDVYCDSCCGGKASPSMHGRIVVEPASAAADVEAPA
jgi:cytochrome c oxidase subunit II